MRIHPRGMRIGTRGSALALTQARLVAQQLQSAGSGAVEMVTIATAGDRDSTGGDSTGGDSTDRDSAGGDKSRWVNELERALAAGEIDLAVHSAKDVPGELGAGLALLGATARAAVEDVLCEAPGDTRGTEHAAGLDRLPRGARVGTSSLRRAAQLRSARADLEIIDIRGNVDTRLRKLREQDLDAIVLARAGLQRLGRESEIGAVLDPARFVPAPGQGTLALQGRAGDEEALAAVLAIADEKALACLLAERALAAALGATCDTPLGAHARDAGRGCLHLHAWVGLPDGSTWIADELLGDFHDPEPLGRRVAERMLSTGAGELLRATQTVGASKGEGGEESVC
jgi:hydroxymethylbilane synthase